MKKSNVRVGCIEMNDIGQGERKNNTNQSHLNSTPPSKPLSAVPPMPYLPIDRDTVDVPLPKLPSKRSSHMSNRESDDYTMHMSDVSK